MSTSKKSTSGGLKTIYSAIIERLSKCKPLINDPKISNWASIIQELEQIARLAESFTEGRTKSAKGSYDEFADVLDQEGVNLWNISGIIRKAGENASSNANVATLRLAAFRLVEAGLEPKPGTDTLIHMLHLANKTGTEFIELGKISVAATVLTSAAKYDELLKNGNCFDDGQRRAMAHAKASYYCARMEAAWKEGNHTLSDYMMRKITDDTQSIGQLPEHVREMLASKLHQIGKLILGTLAEPDDPKPPDALHWLQKAFSIVDQFEDKAASPSELKISILRTMARAHFLSESYDSAEAVLDELLPIIDSSKGHVNLEYQELRWLRLAVLRRRKAGENALLTALKSIIDHMEISDDNVKEILQELRTLTSYRALVTAVHRHCLEHAIRCYKRGSDLIHKLILSLIIHLSKDGDRTRVTSTLESNFTLVYESDLELPSVGNSACLTLLWQYGGRYYKAKKWSEAADWYMAGSHKFFQTNNPAIMAKCFRKASLCYLENRDFAQASTSIKRCPANEARTHYVIFLVAVYQGLEDEAVQAIRDLVNAPDFDRRMLLLATQISHRSEMKNVLLAVLESLLKTLKIGSSGEVVVEAMTLVRCIIKLVLGLLGQPEAARGELIEKLVNHFRTARILTEAVVAQKVVSLISKDLSWLWRTAYNCAVQGCSDWTNSGQQISELFQISRDLLEICCSSSPTSVDRESLVHLVNASFASVSGRVFSIRETMTAKNWSSTNDERLRVMLDEIKNAKLKISDILEKDVIRDSQDSTRITYFLHALRIFQAEFCAYLKAWPEVSLIVEELIRSGPAAVGTYEAIADILWLDQSCPVKLLYQCLEAILRASLEHNALSVEKFSRWLRTLCTVSLSRNTPADRAKAVGYFEQAITVMKDHSDSDSKDETYPLDERHWLLATAYNTGTECLHSCLFDEAKRWFEASTSICRFVPGGKERKLKISETYSTLLSHYQSKS